MSTTTTCDGLPAGTAPPEVHDRVDIVHDVRVPMRDGVELSLDVLRPEAPGAYPVVLVRTPYDKVRNHASPLHQTLVRRGFIVAVQDVRGRFNADGEFFPYMHERADGRDTVDWVAAQEWCNGSVGMLGGSYTGQTQWLAAAEAPAALRAIVPICSPPDLFSNEPILNGVLLLVMAEWMTKVGRRSFQTDAFGDLFAEMQPYYDHLPVRELPAAAGARCDWWEEMLSHPTFDGFWRNGCYQQSWPQITAPALNVTGWYDMNFPGAPTNFVGMRERGPTSQARDGQRLVIGPWPHWVNQTRSFSGVDFGPRALVDLDSHIIRFLDRWLNEHRNGLDDEPPVHVFVMGANRWLSCDAWPPPEAVEIALHLHSGGGANGLKGDGGLNREPAGDEPPDRYVYDPLDPVTVVWNLRDGPVDDRVPSIRDDVLCYTSDVITEPLDVVGPIILELHAASSALDTDWHARLVDVHPSGHARFLCHGALRARFRNSLETPDLLAPGHVEAYRIELDATGNRFLAGHRVRLEVTSSWFPRYDRNLNTGAENNFAETAWVVAEQTVFHDRGRPSRLLISSLPRGVLDG